MIRLNLTKKSWVEVTEHANGYYVRRVFNGGEDGGDIKIYNKLSIALDMAKKLQTKFKA